MEKEEKYLCWAHKFSFQNKDNPKILLLILSQPKEKGLNFLNLL